MLVQAPGSGIFLGQEDPLGESTAVFLPGESHGQKSLEGYSPGGRTESDMAEQLTHFQGAHRRSWDEEAS